MATRAYFLFMTVVNASFALLVQSLPPLSGWVLCSAFALNAGFFGMALICGVPEVEEKEEGIDGD